MKQIISLLSLLMCLLVSRHTRKDKIQLLNTEAALPSSFRFDTLGLRIMTSSVNKRAGTMSMLYANPSALNDALKGDKQHAVSDVLALVTWLQQTDPHWFGASIPGALQSVEIVRITRSIDGQEAAYTKYNGKDLLVEQSTPYQQERIKYILDQQPSILP